jgi:cytochrome c oxidase assembly factor CtaG
VGALHLLLAGAIVYWLPIIGARRRLSGPGRSVYLSLSQPPLDLPGAVIVTLGETAGGIAMIVAMPPVGLAAIAVTWRWVTAEEREADAGELLAAYSEETR